VLTPLADAQAHVRAAVSPLPAVRVPIEGALGLVLAQPVAARELVPPFANTAMDGYAVRAADTVGAPVRLRVVAELPAGRDPAGLHVGEGEAIRIMTGAPMPDGADAVVMVERTRMAADQDGVVEVEVEVRAGNHVRAAGEEATPGMEVFAAGTVLRAGHLGVLASVGIDEVEVVRRARVGVLSTGDELVADARVPLRPGQIRDANRHSLVASLREAGCDAVDLGVVRDDAVEVRAAVAGALASCDALLTSGGVSMGEHDHVKAVLAELGGSQPSQRAELGPGLTWVQVAVKPAKPLSFAVVDGKPVFGLPGNPASSVVSFELFARPALLAMMGHRDVDRPVLPAVADDGFARKPDGRLHLVRVSLRVGDDRMLHAASTGGQASNLLRSLALADGFALVPDGDGVPVGGDVDVMVLR
jgi:molybdopterin molybdotransferase